MNPFAGAPSSPPPPIAGRDYLVKLRRYLANNIARLAPPLKQRGGSTWLEQSYTLLTLGLDPSSAPLSAGLKVPLTLGFGRPAPPREKAGKPVLLRLPPDKLLYLLLRWQTLPQALAHVGRTDVPVSEGVGVAARGAAPSHRADGDVESVRSWVGSIRTVSMPTSGWWKSEEVDEDKVLLELYTVFTSLPGLLIHPPFASDPPVQELLEAGGYTSLGGVDVRVPLDVLRNLQMLELDGFDPRGLLIPPNPLMRSLTVHDTSDADDWLTELLMDIDPTAPFPSPDSMMSEDEDPPRFPNLKHLSLHHVNLLAFPPLPLSSVTHLDLSNNLLNAIPDLSKLHNLVSLNLAHNLITSVRNAPTALGNVSTLNLAHNRLDCLIGLERVLGLKRVDVRSNRLAEGGEVGRLAVLPYVEAVWAANNPFPDDWRPGVAAAFASEGRIVLLDETPLTWTEQRRVDTILDASGRRRHAEQTHNPTPVTPAGLAGGLVPPSPARAMPPSPARSPVPPPATLAVTQVPQRPKSPLAPTPDPTTPDRAATRKVPHKKARRRVVNLD